MSKTPIHEGMLHNTVAMLELCQRQRALAEELLRSYDCRIATLKEFIRANITGDQQGFKLLAPMVGRGTGTTRSFYPNGNSGMASTKRAVQQAKEWSKANEQKAPAGEVPALREGVASDEAREVPAPQSGAGGALPPVEP
jgi:hypothetical protein